MELLHVPSVCRRRQNFSHRCFGWYFFENSKKTRIRIRWPKKNKIRVFKNEKVFFRFWKLVFYRTYTYKEWPKKANNMLIPSVCLSVSQSVSQSVCLSEAKKTKNNWSTSLSERTSGDENYVRPHVLNGRQLTENHNLESGTIICKILWCVKKNIICTVHVTLTRHSCMRAFSNCMKSPRQNNHGFSFWQFWRESNLVQNYLIFNFTVWPVHVEEIIWTWKVRTHACVLTRKPWQNGQNPL